MYLIKEATEGVLKNEKISAIVYHGSEKIFKRFKFSLGGSRQGSVRNAMHFTTDRYNASFYGYNLYEVKLEINTFVEIDFKAITKKYGTQTLVKDAIQQYRNIDAVVIKNITDGYVESDIYIVLNPTCIKSTKLIQS